MKVADQDAFQIVKRHRLQMSTNTGFSSQQIGMTRLHPASREMFPTDDDNSADRVHDANEAEEKLPVQDGKEKEYRRDVELESQGTTFYVAGERTAVDYSSEGVDVSK